MSKEKTLQRWSVFCTLNFCALYYEAYMQEQNHQFTPKIANPENRRIGGFVDPFALMKESSAVDVTQEDLGPAQLSSESIALLDQALNVAGFSPSDLPFADQEMLHKSFHQLSQSADLDAKKLVLKEIVRLVHVGVG